MGIMAIKCAGCEKHMTLHLVPYADLWASDVSKVLVKNSNPEGYEHSDTSVKKHPAYFCTACWKDSS